MSFSSIKKNIYRPIHNSKFITTGIRKKVSEQILSSTFDDSGMHILDEDWDTLIIFDCARYDMFSDIIDMSGTLSKKQSIGSDTADFVKRNFINRQAHDVVYLSANPKVESQEKYLDVFKFVGVWDGNKKEKSGQENNQALTDPTPVIKRAQDLHKQHPNKRHIIHFLPPHVPHLFKDGEKIDADSPYRNYEAAREGTVSTKEMREVYAENLEYVIERTTELLDNIEGKVVLTADHGELLGEGMPMWMKFLHNRWGNQWHKYDFGHYSNVDVAELIEVPWFECPTKTRRKIEPEDPVNDEYETQNIKEKLEVLGYRT